jgi:hypothetical protein
MPTSHPQRPPHLKSEAFIEQNGKKVDAPIHEPILNGINKEAEKRLRLKSAQRALARGLPPEVVSNLFGGK